MNNILIISGHPDLEHSTANGRIIERVQTAFPKTVVRRLDTLYPDGTIDAAAEQAALAQADVIVWQFPFYWYSAPALMRSWLEGVLTYGFAYGSSGDKLHGRKLIVSLTAGGSAEGYSKGGYEGFDIEDYFPQFVSTAHLCGMDYQAPVYSYNMAYLPGISSEADLAAIRSRADEHAAQLIERIREALAS